MHIHESDAAPTLRKQKRRPSKFLSCSARRSVRRFAGFLQSFVGALHWCEQTARSRSVALGCVSVTESRARGLAPEKAAVGDRGRCPRRPPAAEALSPLRKPSSGADTPTMCPAHPCASMWGVVWDMGSPGPCVELKVAWRVLVWKGPHNAPCSGAWPALYLGGQSPGLQCVSPRSPSFL